MPAFYTERERKAALKRLHIPPDAEHVDSSQAARILTWRALEEYGVEHRYNATAVRKHAPKLDVQPALKPDGTVNTRQNVYNVQRLFEIDINPTRTNRGGWTRDTTGKSRRSGQHQENSRCEP